jgi:hypothetical protein
MSSSADRGHTAAILPAVAAADRRKRSPAGRRLDALVWGTVLGAAGGAVLGDAIDGVGAVAGALIGGGGVRPGRGGHDHAPRRRAT